MFEFKITAKHKNSRARTGEFTTPHGVLKTPELATVATEGVIKGLERSTVPTLPINYMIVNTFHIYTKEILSQIEAAGGIHTYLNYDRITASDSGGFQVFSLGFGKAHGLGKVGGWFPGKERAESDTNNPIKISDDDVTFQFNGHDVVLNSEKSMEIQHSIGADIMFAFDECTSPLNTREYNIRALKRTHNWLLRSVAAHKGHEDKQALFAVVQGSEYEDLRRECSQFLAKQDVPGFGIGGPLGKTKQDMLQVIDWTIPYLPEDKPKHMLGIGQVWDIFEGVERGVDLFDCVIPTREARHKVLYTRKGKINVRLSTARNMAIDENCNCEACKNNITQQALAQKFSARDPQAFYYATVHNIQFFADLMKEIRQAIQDNQLPELKEQYFKKYYSENII